jgi:RNA polymerase sigma factor (sigma-70 family)
MRQLQTFLEARARGRPRGPHGARAYQSIDRLFRRVVRRHGWREDDVDDGVQGLWLVFLARFGERAFEPGRGDLYDWLRVVADHALADEERARACRAAGRLGPGAEDALAGHEPDPADAVDLKELCAWVRRLVDRLRSEVSGRDHPAFKLHWLDQLSDAEVARRLGMTENQVWSCNHRTLVKLRFLALLLLSLDENRVRKPSADPYLDGRALTTSGVARGRWTVIGG